MVRLHGLERDLAGDGRWGRGIDMSAFSASRSIMFGASMFGASDRNRTRAVRDTNAVPGQRGRYWPACGSDYCHSSQLGASLSVIEIQVKKELIKKTVLTRALSLTRFESDGARLPARRCPSGLSAQKLDFTLCSRKGSDLAKKTKLVPTIPALYQSAP